MRGDVDSTMCLCVQFVSSPHFVQGDINGQAYERRSAMGVFFRLTALPDEPSVGV